MFGDFGVDQFLAMLFQLAQRAFFIGAHQSAVTRDIGSKNRGKPSIDAVFDHQMPRQKSPKCKRYLRGQQCPLWVKGGHWGTS